MLVKIPLFVIGNFMLNLFLYKHTNMDSIGEMQ